MVEECNKINQTDFCPVSMETTPQFRGVASVHGLHVDKDGLQFIFISCISDGGQDRVFQAVTDIRDQVSGWL